MENLRTNSRTVSQSRGDIDVGLREHMTRVYGLMSLAMAISGVVAFVVGNSQLVYTINTGILRWVVMFAPLIMVFAFGAAVNRMSYAGARTFFFVFAAAMGLSLSYIFVVYNLGSIFTTFLATAVAFLSLSLWGYTTKKDISAWGSFLIMGVVGLIVLSLINIFVKSAGLQFIIAAAGVVIFAGLTAYDTQNIKNQYLQLRNSAADLGKLAIFGALQLYLDFINLFTFLLQFLGQRE